MGFHQPAVVLRKAAGWVKFCAHGAEEVCLSSKVTRGQSRQPVPGSKASCAGEVWDESWGLWSLSCPFLVIFEQALVWSSFYYLFFCRNTSLPKRTGMWKHVLTFRRCSDVKVVWNYRKKECWTPRGQRSPRRLMVCISALLPRTFLKFGGRFLHFFQPEDWSHVNGRWLRSQIDSWFYFYLSSVASRLPFIPECLCVVLWRRRLLACDACCCWHKTSIFAGHSSSKLKLFWI